MKNISYSQMKKIPNSIIIFCIVFFVISFISFPKYGEAQTISTIKSVASISTAGSNQKDIVRTSNGDLHTVYTYNDGTNVQVFYSKSTDGGVTWTETQLTSGNYAQNRPSIAVDSNNNLYVVWWGTSAAATNTGVSQIRYKKYNGTTWSGITDLTDEITNAQTSSSLVVDSNDNVHIVWQGTQIRYKKYNGTTWSGITDLTASGSGTQIRPFIAVDYENNLHVVWSNFTGGVISYIKFSTVDNPGAIKQMTTYANAGDEWATMAIDSLNNVHIVWQHVLNSGTGDKRIYYRKYTPGTDTLGDIDDLGGAVDIAQWNPKIAVDSHDYLHVIWNRDPGIIRYVKYVNSWGSVQDLVVYSVANAHANFVFFPTPIIKNVQINRPKEGFAFIWTAGTSIKFYKSADLDWDMATPPALSSGSPSDTLPSNTTNATLSLTTDENSTCKYDTNSGIAYSSMANTFGTTGGTSHSTSVQVSSNSSYTFYVRCFGPHTAFNTNDYTISFSVERPPAGHPPIMIPPIIPPIFIPTNVVITPPAQSNEVQTNISNVSVSIPLVITKNYKLSDRGEEVKTLQQWLNTNGFTVAEFGPGSKGQETSMFGSLTKKAIIKFQIAHNLKGDGIIGPLTRKSLGL